MTSSTPKRVVLEDPEGQSLLGLLLHGMLSANLADEDVAGRLASFSGDIEVSAGEMTVSLHFDEGRLTIRRGHAERPRARVRGDMSALLDIALGGGLIGPVLDGKLHVSGNPFVLLKLLPLMRRPAPPPSAASER